MKCILVFFVLSVSYINSVSLYTVYNNKIPCFYNDNEVNRKFGAKVENRFSCPSFSESISILNKELYDFAKVFDVEIYCSDCEDEYPEFLEMIEEANRKNSTKMLSMRLSRARNNQHIKQIEFEYRIEKAIQKLEKFDDVSSKLFRELPTIVTACDCDDGVLASERLYKLFRRLDAIVEDDRNELEQLLLNCKLGGNNNTLGLDYENYTYDPYDLKSILEKFDSEFREATSLCR